MSHIKRYFQTNGISLILLLLISIRLIPFNLLHYHNNKFANFEALGAVIVLQSTEEIIKAESKTCSFHKFLTLINHSFVFDIEYKISSSVEYAIGNTPISDSEGEFVLFDILNKGSPKLV